MSEEKESKQDGHKKRGFLKIAGVAGMFAAFLCMRNNNKA